MASDGAGIKGTVAWVLKGPDGKVKDSGYVENLVTQVGDQLYGEQGSGAASPNVPTGMRLGTGTTAAAKTGAGAAIVTYISGSNQAFDGTFPSSALSGASRRIAYRSTWAAGDSTNAAIAEAVITNETPLTDVAGTAANTISRVVFGTAINKGASDSLELSWNHDLLGA